MTRPVRIWRDSAPAILQDRQQRLQLAEPISNGPSSPPARPSEAPTRGAAASYSIDIGDESPPAAGRSAGICGEIRCTCRALEFYLVYDEREFEYIRLYNVHRACRSLTAQLRVRTDGPRPCFGPSVTGSGRSGTTPGARPSPTAHAPLVTHTHTRHTLRLSLPPCPPIAPRNKKC